jgi:hypothetical protein
MSLLVSGSPGSSSLEPGARKRIQNATTCPPIRQLERQYRFLRSNFEPRRFFANHLDFQDQLDRWAEKVNGRTHRTIRGIPAERLAKERQQRPLGALRVETDRRWVARVPQQPLIRIDRNDYPIDPVFA